MLERSYDGTRVASLAEYRNRHYVYQFGRAGYHAFRAVEEVLSARGEDASLSRLALADLLADLTELAAANDAGDGELVYRKLSRLDTTLSDMAERAAGFYLMLGDLVRTTEVTPESFLAHKDAVLAHMREFSTDLARYGPKLAAALARVQETGIDRMLGFAAAHDERMLLSVAERHADWRARWRGLERWFVGAADVPSESERLRDGTMSAIAAVLALLRRLTETRRGGVSRESQLRHLAAWFAAAPDEQSAHALFDAVFDLGRPRHFSVVHPDPETVPVTTSWWDAPPVPIARTLAETGRTPVGGSAGAGAAQRIRDPAVAGAAAGDAAGAGRGGTLPRGGRRGRAGVVRAGDRGAVGSARRGAVGAGSGQRHRAGCDGHPERGAADAEPGPGGHGGPDGAGPAASGRAAGERAVSARRISPLDRDSYQRAARLILSHHLVTTRYPDRAALPLLRRWATELREDLLELFGYRLEVTETTARLFTVADRLDPGGGARSVTDRPFDRRRYAYLALALAALGRAGGQITLSELAEQVASEAGQVPGVELAPERATDRDAFVDAVAWLAARGGDRTGGRRRRGLGVGPGAR